MNLKSLILVGLMACSICGFANPVVVKMNAVSKTMTLVSRETGEPVALPEPENQQYNLQLEPGKYELSAYATDGKTLNGKIVVNVKDSLTTQQFTVLTCTAYVSNKNTDQSSWTREKGDYELKVSVNTREGEPIEQTPGNSITAGRYTFLALNGNSYNVAFEPSETHREEGYMTLYRGGTLTANINVYGAIPMGGDFAITIPDGARLQLGMKFTHFTDFTPVDPTEIIPSDGVTTYRYKLANGQVYNYRTWRPGGLTHAGYFTMNTADPAKCPEINFTDEDFASHDPKAINHNPQSNKGYETGDLLLNINPRHHLNLEVGEEFDVHGMRMWELTDNSTNNYFFEPDLHYTVLDTDFKPSTDIIEIENADTDFSAWSKITAKKPGVAIVMVTYDGICLDYYNNADKKEYLGGEYWGAIWPENTGVFVVTVGEGPSAVKPNMTVNEKYNMDALRLAGNDVDAEHDVFYYLEGEEGFRFTFKPEGVATVEMATPEISATEATYAGFSAEGVEKDEDGTYTLLLKEGRTIVRLTDEAGKSVYQVLRAKPCRREITNQTRPGSKVVQPGDKVKIQYSGLYHPANKIAGIYNMSAYVTYNGVPNGSSLILGSGQYTFGSAASAQALTVEIPADYDAEANPEWVMDEGVIQVNGYGDPIGNHRNTSKLAGRSPNFTAVPHKTYFGNLPDIRLALTPVRNFNITLSGLVDNTDVTVTCGGNFVTPDKAGVYTGTYGTYSVVANAEGYKCFRQDFTIGDESEDNVVFPVVLQPLGKAWDGFSMSEPAKDESGTYIISKGAELAWFADNVNRNGGKVNGELVNDIELGNFEWTPIGTSSKNYSGTFKGNGHTITEIFVGGTANHRGLFGYVKDGSVECLTVEGCVAGAQYVGGLAGYVAGESTIDRCANRCAVSGTKTYVGGLVGYLYSATASMTNCYNTGHISGTTNCGGLVGGNNANATMRNIFNVGVLEGTTVGACVGGTTAKNNLSNAYSVFEYQITTGQISVSVEQMASGEIAYSLGEAFYQTIGSDPYPGFAGLKVCYNETDDRYFNLLDCLRLDSAELSLDMNDKPSMTLTATWEPIEAVSPRFVWSSSDERVVTVEQDGNSTSTLHAAGDGKAEVKVEHADNPAVYDTCLVTVTGKTSVVETVFGETGCETVDIFDINGIVIALGATPEEVRTLSPGLYVVKVEGTVRRILVK